MQCMFVKLRGDKLWDLSLVCYIVLEPQNITGRRSGWMEAGKQSMRLWPRRPLFTPCFLATVSVSFFKLWSWYLPNFENWVPLTQHLYSVSRWCCLWRITKEKKAPGNPIIVNTAVYMTAVQETCISLLSLLLSHCRVDLAPVAVP